tara:strand:+ start:443 stop:793 length:351 start_codon:yes stop_codon:yes gene_type:complete
MFKYILILFSLLISDNFQNIQVLEHIDSKSKMRKYMKSISKDLGVECRFCHDMDDKSLDTPHKEIAREMILLTRQINDYLHAFEASEEDEEKAITITCWTCHKGHAEVQTLRPESE